jgi:hypothetical protein
MNIKRLTLAILLSVGALGLVSVPAMAQDSILLKLELGSSNYCHLKFPAISEATLSSDRPTLKTTGDVIDFYGPCNYEPTGKAAVQAQRLDAQRRFDRGHSD